MDIRKFVLPDKVYAALKWICILYLPIVGLIAEVGSLLSFDTRVICGIISAVAVCAGAIVKISDTNYYNSQKNSDKK